MPSRRDIVLWIVAAALVFSAWSCECKLKKEAVYKVPEKSSKSSKAAKVSLVGKAAPACTAAATSEENLSLSDLKGSWVVLYFYPKDNTSGCTKEAIDFSQLLPKFKRLNAVVIGLSPDSPESHIKFIEKQNLSVILLSDKEKSVMKKYGAPTASS